MTAETVLSKEIGQPKGAGEEASETEYVIEPSKGWAALDWKELWRYRELLYFLTWRDVKVRYKQSVLGAAWAILQPVAMMVVFTVLLGRMAGLAKNTGGIPYPIYVYAALLPWQFFASSVNNSSGSLVSSSNLITKVYFPRLIIPLAATGAAAVDFCVSSTVLLGMMFFYHWHLSWQLLLVPLFLFGTLLAATGVGMVLSALTVEFRDFQYVVPFVMQLWMFVSPVMYPSSIVAPKWRAVFALNPMAGLIDGFRAAFLALPVDWPHVGISLAAACVAFVLGITYFRRVERRFADVI